MMDHRVFGFYSALLLGVGLYIYPPLPATANGNYYNASAGPEMPAAADSGEESFGARTMVVTSLQKCYEQIGREEALDIQRNFIKPYQECQHRLGVLLKKQQEQKVAAEKEAANKPAGAAPADNSGQPGGFFRVQKPAPAAEKKT